MSTMQKKELVYADLAKIAEFVHVASALYPNIAPPNATYDRHVIREHDIEILVWREGNMPRTFEIKSAGHSYWATYDMKLKSGEANFIKGADLDQLRALLPPIEEIEL